MIRLSNHLQTSGLRLLPRPFHGHITEIVRLGANGGFARYRLVIEPSLAFLGHDCDSYVLAGDGLLTCRRKGAVR